MSIGSLGGILGSAAGTPLAQAKGSDVDRAGQEATAQARAAAADKAAENAAGIGETAEDQQASERDADGRRLWETDERKKQEEAAQQPPRQSKDASGQSGNGLDLSG
jgi:hypothetical protein